MTHIALDSQEEAVKRFFQSLSVNPQGTVVELNGRPVACVVPVGDGDGEDSAGTPWTEEKNARRCALIDLEIDGILTPAEAVELQGLQREMLRHRRRVAPLPLAETRKLHEELLAKAQRAVSNE